MISVANFAFTSSGRLLFCKTNLKERVVREIEMQDEARWNVGK